MKRPLIALAILALTAGIATAAPGDPRVVQGTLEWPASLSAAEPFVVMRGEDGRPYYVDVSAAQRRVPGTLTGGSRIAILGVEGTRPHELAAIALAAGDATSLGLTAPSASPALSTSIPSTASTDESMWRLDGTVQSVSGTAITLRTDDGTAHAVEASQLSDVTLKALRPGHRISLFGVPRPDRRLVANGFIQSSDPAPPAASPRSSR